MAAAAVVGVRKRAWRFACYLNNENSAIAAQLGEVTATKTQQARETGVRVVWPAAGRDGGGTTTTTTAAQPARAFATSPRLASAIFAPPPPTRAHRPSHACCGMSRPRSKIQQKNEMVARRTAEWALNQSRWSEPPTKTNSTVSRPVALAEPPASRLAESTRHTNMSERALSLFLHRTSPRFRTSRVSRQPNQRR